MAYTAQTRRDSKPYFLTYSMLIDAARYRGVLTYKGIALATGLPASGNAMGDAVGRLLAEISSNEVDQERPMLGALVVEKATGVPGPGFFKLARNLKKLQSESKSDEHKFWKDERDRVYAEWGATEG
jgi:hypothetical protein